MKVPKSDQAIVDRSKIVDYLLSSDHPDGSPKAIFFRHFGFCAPGWERLAKALRDHIIYNELESKVETPYGIRYIIDGKINSPDGRNPAVRSVWISEKDEGCPRLITAYPVKE